MYLACFLLFVIHLVFHFWMPESQKTVKIIWLQMKSQKINNSYFRLENFTTVLLDFLIASLK